MTMLRTILAVFLPPAAIYLTVGLGVTFWFNLILTLIFFVPGMVHAIWVVLRAAEADRQDRAGRFMQCRPTP